MATQGFDKTFYLNAKLEQLQNDPQTAADWAGKDADFLEARLQNGFGMTAEQHYEQYGFEEGLAPNAFFSPDEYIRAKATAMFNDPAAAYLTVDAAAEDFVSIWNEIGNGNVYEHYLQYGEDEGVNPSNDFDVSAYYEAKLAQLQADGNTDITTVEGVKAAFEAAGLTALEHFVEFGQDEGIAAPAVPADEQVEVDNSVAGQTFTLTTDADVIDGTADNDTIRGLVDTSGTTDTLTAADFIDGGEGTDTLNLTTVGTSANTGGFAGADISNVENFFVRDLAGSESTYDFNSVVGEEQVWADRATNKVTFADLETDTVVGVQGNGSTNLGDVDFNMATAADDVNIVLAGGLRGAPAITNTSSGAATSATLTSTGAANTTGTVMLAAAGSNSVETFNVVAESDLTATLTAADFAADATLNISGEGDVNLGTNGTFDTIAAGSATGDLTLNANTTTAKVTAGSGDDELTVAAALVDGASINLGAGDDALLNSSGSVSADVMVDGGAGRDTVAASLINAGNGGNFQNFEVLGLDSGATLDLSLLTGSTIESFELIGGNNTIQGASIEQSLSVVEDGATGATLDFTDATGDADSYDISFDAATTGTVGTPTSVGAGTVTLDGVENINIASGAEAGVNANSITLGADTAETVTITGDQALTVDFSSSFGNVANGNGVSAIDASTATGDVDIDVDNVTADAAGLTVTGGAGDDTITTTGFEVTVAGGAGDDTFEVGASTGTSVLVTIDDLASDDKIDFGLYGLTPGALGEAEDVSGASDLSSAFSAAINGNGSAGISWFEFGNNTYAIADTTSAGTVDASDVLVEITGSVDLENSAFTAGGELTIA